MDGVALPMRTGAHDDWDAIAGLLAANYHNPFPDEMREQFRPIFEPDRALVITDEDTVVSHISARTRDVTVPGGVASAAHLTLAAVAPTHRRRGLLSRMFTQSLRNTRDAHEPFAIFWPSEARIYSRYGCGIASYQVNLEIDTRELRFARARADRPVPDG